MKMSTHYEIGSVIALVVWFLAILVVEPVCRVLIHSGARDEEDEIQELTQQPWGEREQPALSARWVCDHDWTTGG